MQTLLEQFQKGTYGGNAELLSYSLYDTAQIKSTQTGYTFYSVPAGAVDPSTSTVKKSDKTNVTGNGGVMPQGQHFEAHELRIFIRSAAAFNSETYAKLLDLIGNTTIRFKIQGKDNVLLLNLQEVLGNAFMSEVVATTAGNNLYPMNAKFSGSYILNIPITLAALTNYGIEMEHWTAPDATLDALGVEFMISLGGQLLRAN